jgi:uncharacterized protein
VRYLLDANVLIALTDVDHTSYEIATAWFQNTGGLFATCPVTQGALIRFIVRVKPVAGLPGAKALLKEVVSVKGHEFWPDSLSFVQLPDTGVTGYRQVTDAYLVALARHHKGRLATLDRALAAIHSAVAVLVE